MYRQLVAITWQKGHLSPHHIVETLSFKLCVCLMSRSFLCSYRHNRISCPTFHQHMLHGNVLPDFCTDKEWPPHPGLCLYFPCMWCCRRWGPDSKLKTHKYKFSFWLTWNWLLLNLRVCDRSSQHSTFTKTAFQVWLSRRTVRHSMTSNPSPFWWTRVGVRPGPSGFPRTRSD